MLNLRRYKVKGVMFEIVLSITIMVYLFLLSFALMVRNIQQWFLI